MNGNPLKAVFIFAILIGGGIALLFPSKPEGKKRIAGATEQPRVRVAPLVEIPAEQKGIANLHLDDRSIIELIDKLSLTEDPSRPDRIIGSSDDALKSLPKDNIKEILARGESVIGNGGDRERHFFNLGRIAMIAGEDDYAAKCFKEAADRGHAAAKAYLTNVAGTPLENFALLDEAQRGGFAPAGGMRKHLKELYVAVLDSEFLHPEDPDKPRGKVGKTDGALAGMDEVKLENFISTYGEWVKTQKDTPRLAFGIGRAAKVKNDVPHAEEYLRFAAGNGSAGALAYLTRLPSEVDHFDENIKRLEKSVEAGFAPAKELLEALRGLAFDLNEFKGSKQVMKALYEERVGDLLGGKAFFEKIDLPPASRQFFQQALLMEYMSEFTNFFDHDTSIFTGDLRHTFAFVENGKGAEGKRKLNGSISGAVANKFGGIAVAGENLLNGKISDLLINATQGRDASLEQRREQIRTIALSDAKHLWKLTDGGNRRPTERVYRSACEFIDKYKGSPF